MSKIITIEQLRALASKTVGFTSKVVTTIAEALEEMADAKADKENCISVTIPITGWKTDSSDFYPYYYDIAVAGITAKDGAEIAISVDTLQVASDCGLCPTNETLVDGIRVRAASIPESEMETNIWIRRGRE